MTDLNVTDPTFVDDLKESELAVWVAAKWLHSRGHFVLIPPTIIRPDARERAAYSDGGDLQIIRKPKRHWERVEVKRRLSINFTDGVDFPFETVIVDVAHSWDNADPKPVGYIIVSSDLSSGMIVNTKTTSSKWRRVEKYDAHVKRSREYYECPVNLCKFVKFDK